jgi:hypothetical protein
MRRCTLLATLLPTCVVAMQTRLPPTRGNVKAEALLKEAQALRQQAAQETRALHASRLALEHGEDVTVDALVSVLGTDRATAGRLLAEKPAATWRDFSGDASGGWYRARTAPPVASLKPKKTRRVSQKQVDAWGGAAAYAMPLGQATPFVVSFLAQLHAGKLAFAVDEAYRCFTIVELFTLPFVAYAICNLGADVPRVVRVSAIQALLLVGVVSSLELALFLAEPAMTPLAASLSGAIVGSYAVGAPVAAAAITALSRAPADVGIVSAVADLVAPEGDPRRD